MSSNEINKRGLEMADEKKVKVCKACSNVNVKELKKRFGKQVAFGCVARCLERNPQLTGKTYGYINGEFVVCDKVDDFIKKVEEALGLA